VGRDVGGSRLVPRQEDREEVEHREPIRRPSRIEHSLPPCHRYSREQWQLRIQHARSGCGSCSVGFKARLALLPVDLGLELHEDLVQVLCRIHAQHGFQNVKTTCNERSLTFTEIADLLSYNRAALASSAFFLGWLATASCTLASAAAGDQ
jgi:hypothetical protein